MQATMYRLEITGLIRGAAAAFGDSLLRTLDTVHLTTAMRLGVELDTFVTYDKRLLAAAGAMGLPTASPAG